MSCSDSGRFIGDLTPSRHMEPAKLNKCRHLLDTAVESVNSVIRRHRLVLNPSVERVARFESCIYRAPADAFDSSYLLLHCRAVEPIPVAIRFDRLEYTVTTSPTWNIRPEYQHVEVRGGSYGDRLSCSCWGFKCVMCI